MSEASPELDEDSIPPQDGPGPLPRMPSTGNSGGNPQPPGATEVGQGADFSGDLSPASIAKMMRAVHPFYSYFEYVASTRYPRNKSTAAKVQQLRVEHGKLYWTCITLDIVMILVPLSLVFVAAVGLIGYKTLWL